MTGMLQLNPPWHIMTPAGEGFGYALIDYGPTLNTVVLFAPLTGEHMVAVDLKEVKMGENWMYNQPAPKPFEGWTI